MANAKKAVEIAKDVIVQLRLGKLSASNFEYFGTHIRDDVDFDSDLRDILNNNAEECTVCALGGLFVANVLRNDNFPAGPFIDRMNESFQGSSYRRLEMIFEDFNENLLTVFSEDQLRLIEAVFEGKFVTDFRCDLPQYTYDLESLFRYFHSKYPDPNDRMRAIMLNIIRNKGKFIPPKRFQTK